MTKHADITPEEYDDHLARLLAAWIVAGIIREEDAAAAQQRKESEGDGKQNPVPRRAGPASIVHLSIRSSAVLRASA
jgi:hypothetical protein